MSVKGQYRVRVRAGERYGDWTVLADGAGVNNKAPCRCSCGHERDVNVRQLIGGKSKRCTPCGHRENWRTRRQPREPEPEPKSYHPPTVPDASCLVIVRQRLTAARHDGYSFDAAWRSAIRGSNGYRETLQDTEQDWRAAYDRSPAPPPVRAFSLLAVDADLSSPFDEPPPSSPTFEQRVRISAERDPLRHASGV